MPIILKAAIDPMTDPATTPGCFAGVSPAAAVEETADAEDVLDEPVVEDGTLEEVEELKERVLVIVRVLKTVDVPVVVAMIVLPVST